MEDYAALEALFMEGVAANQEGNTSLAEELFRKVLELEPRFAEPRLELAMFALARKELEEAETQAREAVDYLEKGWMWLENFTEEQLLSHACNLLGEILKTRSTTDATLALKDPAIRELWLEAGSLFERAVELDPDNADAVQNYYGWKEQRKR